MSVVFNVDENLGQVEVIQYISDVRLSYASLWVCFISTEKLDFSSTENTIKCKGSLWFPYSYKETFVSEYNWFYSAVCYPNVIFKKIERISKDARSLAADIGLMLTSDSKSLPFHIPQQGVLLGALLNKYRFDSANLSSNNLRDMLILNVDSTYLRCNTIGNIAQGVATSLEASSDLPISINYVDDTYKNKFTVEQAPKNFSYKSTYTNIFGRKISILGTLTGTVGKMYNLNLDYYTNIPNMMLVKQSYDSRNVGKEVQLTFAELLL